MTTIDLPPAAATGRGRNAARLFVLVFAVTAGAGLAFTFLRPAIYQSAATLAIEPPLDDAGTEPRALLVETERQRATSHAVLSRTLAALGGGGAPDPALPADPAALESMLEARTLPGTSWLQLVAEGPLAQALPVVVEAWVGAYFDVRTRSTGEASDSQSEALRAELAGLEARVGEQRAALAEFRRAHDIVSLDRAENQALAQMRSASEALSRAREEQVSAAARLSAVREALAAGRPLDDGREQAAVANLEARATELREQLRDFEEQFTPRYMELDPKIVAVQRKLEDTEARIRERHQAARAAVLAEAEQELARTRQRVATLEQRLEENKSGAAEFSARFAEHQALQAELQQLEDRVREVRSRLIGIETPSGDRRARVSVLEKPYTPDTPVRPHYRRDALRSLGAAALLALLVSGVYLLATRPPRQPAYAGAMPGIYSYHTQVFGPSTPAQAFPAPGATASLPGQAPAPAIEHQAQAAPRELSPAEVETLLEAGDAHVRALAGVFLCGLTAAQASALRWDAHVERDGSAIRAAQRTLQPPPRLAADLAALGATAGDAAPLWQDANEKPLAPDELAALVTCAAHDAHLSDPGAVTPQVLRHTYFAFLARQGIRSADLRSIAGDVPPSHLLVYSRLAPPAATRALADIELSYPALATRP